MNEREKRRIVNIRVDEDVWQVFCDYAEKDGLSKTQLVRNLMSDFVKVRDKKRKESLKKWHDPRNAQKSSRLGW